MRPSLVVAALCVVAGTAPSGAQDAARESRKVEPPVGGATRLDQVAAPVDFWQVEVDASGMLGADGKQRGDFDLARVETGISYNTTLRDDLRLRLGFNAQQSFYDFDDVTTVVPGTDDPWDRLQAYRLGGALFWRANERWSYFGGLEVRSAFESGADFGETLELRATAGAEYRVSDTLKFTFGVAGGTQIEDDALVFPIVGVDWSIDEDTRLASRDLGLVLSRRLTPEWSLGVFGGFEFRDWRLDDSRSTIPGGVAREKRAVFGVEVRHRPSNRFEFALEGGVVAWQKIKALDDDGRKVGEQEFDPAPYAGVSVIVRF